MRSTKKTVITIIGWIALSALAVFALLLACWNLLPDAELNPEARTYFAPATPPAPDRNGFFSVWGFTAAADRDPHEVGKQIVAESDRLIATERDFNHFDINRLLGVTKADESSRKVTAFCDHKKEWCPTVYLQKREEILKEISAKKLYLDRYQRWQQFPEYGNAQLYFDARSPIPPWNPILQVSALRDASVLFRMEDARQRKAALDDLVADLTHWRRILESDDWLITQMIAVVAVKRKFELASHILNTWPELARSESDVFKLIASPLDYKRVNLAKTMRNEGRTTFKFYEDTATDVRTFSIVERTDSVRATIAASVVHAGGFKANDSLNLAYAQFQAIEKFVLLPPKAALQAAPGLEAELCAPSGGTLKRIFYNPIGRNFNCDYTANWETYVFRIHDLIALQRQLELQRRMLEAGIRTDGVAAFIASAGADVFDPYLEAPMQWDATNSSLVFTPRGARGHFSGRLRVFVNKN